MRDTNSFIYSSSIDNIDDINASFSRGTMRIAYHGKNRNGSFISKQAFVNSIDTIYNRPIVCNYSRETDSIGGHDVEVVKDGSSLRMVNITEPVGVVPESARTWWESVFENDGTEHEYLCCDILIWKRQQAYQHLIDKCVTDESMEISITERHYDDEGCVHIDKFEFTAFCLLERDRPCFESAGITAFSVDECKEEFSRMMEDFHREFTVVTSANNADDINEQILSKGGQDKMEDLMAKYGLNSDDIDFETEGMSEEELETRFAEIASAKGETENEDVEVVADEPEVVSEEEQFSLTHEQLVGEIMDSLREIQIEDVYCGGMTNRYWYYDVDIDIPEVYVTDAMDNFHFYGIPYTLEGDRVVLDFKCAKRKKITYADFEDAAPEGAAFNMLSNICESFKGKYDALHKTCEELQAFKLDVLDKQASEEREAVLKNFSDLNGNEMFESLVANCKELSVAELEDKCYAIRGRCATKKFSVDQDNNPTVKLPVQKESDDVDEPYGGVFREFGFTK